MQVPPHIGGHRRYVAGVPLFAVSVRQKGGVVIPPLHELTDLSTRRHWELWFCHQAKREDEFPVSVRARLVKAGSEAHCLTPKLPVPVATFEIDTDGLRDDGPTIEQYVDAGYLPENYPPKGWAIKASPGLDAWIKRASDARVRLPWDENAVNVRRFYLNGDVTPTELERSDDSAPGEVVDAQGLEPILMESAIAEPQAILAEMALPLVGAEEVRAASEAGALTIEEIATPEATIEHALAPVRVNVTLDELQKLTPAEIGLEEVAPDPESPPGSRKFQRKRGR